MIIQGSNNIQLNVYITEKGELASLAGSLVSVVIMAGPRKVVKPATIAGNGLVTALLTSDDLSSSGTYYVQAIVNYSDGRIFKSEQSTFPVGAAL